MINLHSIAGYAHFFIRKKRKENIEKNEKIKIKIKRKEKKDDNNSNNNDDDKKNEKLKLKKKEKEIVYNDNNTNSKNRRSNEDEEKNIIIDRLNDDMEISVVVINGSDNEKKIILDDVMLMNNKGSIIEKDQVNEELKARHIKSNKVNTGCVVESVPEAKDLESGKEQTSVSNKPQDTDTDKNNLLIEGNEIIINSNQKHVSVSQDNNNNDKELTPQTYSNCKYDEMIKNDKTLTGDEIVINSDRKHISDSKDNNKNDKELSPRTYSTRSIQYKEMIKNDKTPTGNKMIINYDQKHVSDSQDNNKNDKELTFQTYSNCKYDEMIKNDKILTGDEVIMNSDRKNVSNSQDNNKNDKELTLQTYSNCKYDEMIKNNKSINVNEGKTLVKFEDIINRSKRGKKGGVNKYEDMAKSEIKIKKQIAYIDNRRVTSRFLGLCKNCHRAKSAQGWCTSCEIEKFEQNFKNWASGNSKVDEIIQVSQLNATDCYNYFEWINSEEIINVEYVVEGGFGKIFKGMWITGPKKQYNWEKKTWKSVPIAIALKEPKLDDFSLKTGFDQFLNEFQNHRKFLTNSENHVHVLRCFGITKSPDDYTKWNVKSEKRPKPNSYMMVMVWANDGDLFDYVKKHARDKNFTWYKRLGILEELSGALESIHNQHMIHKDLHCGNILMDDKNIFQFPAISDFGLCGIGTKSVKGVMAFTAPEHLKEKPEEFTNASDVYSFGIIMWVICCCKLPYEEFKDDFLQYHIVNGLRPTIPKYIPQEYATLIKKCWDSDPKKRPEALELKNTFIEWRKQYESNEFFNVEKGRLRRIQNPDIFIDAFESQEIERSKLIQLIPSASFDFKTKDVVEYFRENQDDDDDANLLTNNYK